MCVSVCARACVCGLCVVCVWCVGGVCVVCEWCVGGVCLCVWCVCVWLRVCGGASVCMFVCMC